MKYATNIKALRAYLDRTHGIEYENDNVIYLLDDTVAEIYKEENLCVVYAGADDDRVVEKIRLGVGITL